MTYTWSQEYEDAVAERNMLIIEQARLRDALTKSQAEVARLRAKVRELEDIPTCPVCGEPMTRRNADGTLGCNLCYALDGDV